MPRGFFPSTCLCLISLATLARPVGAWDQHTLITRASLSTLPALAEETVPYISFEKFISDFGYASPRKFNEAIQIRKEYEFLPHLGEDDGSAVSLLDVLAEYSDEPDWGMDREIFGQYPELWREEYSRMGGKVGTPSQAFRHMYWQEFSWRMPLRTLKSPILFSPMGLAPERATLFIVLSRQARLAGHPYWAARFVANALHYLEDLAQPFHASQTPTKRFLWMPLFDRDRGSGFENYVLQVQNIIAYYHYSFENYIGHEMREYYEASVEETGAGKEFVGARTTWLQR